MKTHDERTLSIERIDRTQRDFCCSLMPNAGLTDTYTVIILQRLNPS